MAIVIAGALIAGAVYFSQVGPRQLPAPDANSGQAGVPQPTPPVASLAIRPITPEDHIRGPEDAKITILEYSDLECPYCKVFHESMIEALEEYPNDVRWVYRHAPLVQLHTKAPAEANAAECAAEQGKFWEFSDVIFAATSSNDSIVLADLPEHARTAGVADIPAFEACVAENKFAEKVDADLQDGIAAGLQGTPFNMIVLPDGTKQQLGGGVPYPQLKSIIESHL